MRIKPLGVSATKLLLFAGCFSFLQGQAFDNAEDLSAELLARLETSPALAVASFYGSNAGRGAVVPIQTDERLHLVKYRKSLKEGFTEVICDRLEDGLRKTFPGTTRIEITSRCLVKSPTNSLSWQVLVQKEDGKIYAELGNDAQRYFVGTLLPTGLSNSLPDLSKSESTLMEMFGWHYLPPRGSYQVNMKLRSKLKPTDFMKAFTTSGSLVETRDGFARWERSIDKTLVGTTKLWWSASGSENIYYISAGFRGLDLSGNGPAPTTTRKPRTSATPKAPSPPEETPWPNERGKGQIQSKPKLITSVGCCSERLGRADALLVTPLYTAFQVSPRRF